MAEETPGRKRLLTGAEISSGFAGVEFGMAHSEDESMILLRVVSKDQEVTVKVTQEHALTMIADLRILLREVRTVNARRAALRKRDRPE